MLDADRCSPRRPDCRRRGSWTPWPGRWPTARQLAVGSAASPRACPVPGGARQYEEGMSELEIRWPSPGRQAAAGRRPGSAGRRLAPVQDAAVGLDDGGRTPEDAKAQLDDESAEDARQEILSGRPICRTPDRSWTTAGPNTTTVWRNWPTPERLPGDRQGPEGSMPTPSYRRRGGVRRRPSGYEDGRAEADEKLSRRPQKAQRRPPGDRRY